MLPTDGTVHAQPAPGSEPASTREPEPEPTLKSAPEPRRSPLGEFQPPSGCITVFISLVLLLWGVLTHDWGSGAAGYTRASQAAESPDAGTQGIGEESVASVSPAQTPPSSEQGVTRPMPDGPTPGQKRPPCNRQGTVVINGGCWRRIEDFTPPCGPGDYEYKERCYVPLLIESERVPTSDDP